MLHLILPREQVLEIASFRLLRKCIPVELELFQTVELKDRADDMVENLLRQGKVSGYNCTPEYRGNSFVPCKVTIEANMKGEPVFTETINIW